MEFGTVIDVLKDNNMWDYPYYYLGVDSWMDGTDHISDYSDGLTGSLGVFNVSGHHLIPRKLLLPL